MTGLSSLPSEVWELIFSSVPPNIIFSKLLEGFPKVGEFSNIQRIAFECTFGSSIEMNSSKKFNPQAFNPEDLSVFLIHNYQYAYEIVKYLLNYNLEVLRCEKSVFPNKIILSFNITNSPDQLEYFTKTVKLLNIGYQALTPCVSIPRISFQLYLNRKSSPQLISQIFHKIDSLSEKIHRIQIVNRTAFDQKITFNPLTFDNLTELFLWNANIDDYSFSQSISRSRLKVLDLSSNKLTNLKCVTLPLTIEKLIVRANNLTVLADLSYFLKLEVIDLSINKLSNLSGLKLPPNLLALRMNYNDIKKLNLKLTNCIEILELSNNFINSLDDVTFPVTLRDLHINGNRISSFASGFFKHLRLKLLNLSDNKIDDLDELGQLPQSLEELYMNNTEIDHHNDLVNILTPHLNTLSMMSSGLMTLTNVHFPENFIELNLSRNDIIDLGKLTFCDGFRTLNLSNNKLFKFELCANTITYLNLSNNKFRGIQFELPSKLLHFLFDDNYIGEISNKFLEKLPKTIIELSLNNTSLTCSEAPIFFLDFLPGLKRLSLRGNVVDVKNFVFPLTMSLQIDHFASTV